LCGLLAAGCFEGKADVHFNPDGSGKIVGTVTFPLEQPWTSPKRALGAGKDATEVDMPPEEQMKDAATNLIKKSKGIDTWKDVHFQRLGDGRVLFQGTAYFKDFSKVKLYPSTAMAFFFGQEQPGSLSLVLSRPKDKDPAKAPAKTVSADEMEKKFKDERQKYQRIRPTVGLLIHTMKYTVDFHAPGTPSDIHGFEQTRGALAWALDGQKLLKALDTAFSDGPSLRQAIVAGETLGDATFPRVEKAAFKRIFGPGADTWARYTGDLHDLFDYKAETTEARKAFPQMMIGLGLEKPKEPPAGKKPPADDPDKVPGLRLPDKLPNIPAPILPGL
jgi:hypothetical protein